MRKLVKGVLPQPMLRHVRAALTTRNQRKLLKLCSQGAEIHLAPVNRVEHYFHFLFDLMLPLGRLIAASPPDVIFAVQPFGIFTNRLKMLHGGRIRIEGAEESKAALRREPLLGMNPQFVNLKYEDLTAFKQHVMTILDISTDTPANKVLLIERMPPNEYFSKEAIKRGAGTSRRSIPNHGELASAIGSIVEAPLEFCNAQLENISFEEQVLLFDRAALVIGQHGAGLANCVWMRPGSQVIELSHNISLRHFQFLSQALRHRHMLHPTSGSHATVDVAALLSVVRRQTL